MNNPVASTSVLITGPETTVGSMRRLVASSGGGEVVALQCSTKLHYGVFEDECIHRRNSGALPFPAADPCEEPAYRGRIRMKLDGTAWALPRLSKTGLAFMVSL